MAALEGQGDKEDPRVDRLLARLKIIMLVSMAVFLAGMVAVAAVIIYRIAGAPATPARSRPPAALAMPAGSRILGTSADGRRLYVTVARPDGAEAVLVFDAATHAYRGRIAVVPPRPPTHP